LERKRQLEEPRHSWDDNIKRDSRKQRGKVNPIHLDYNKHFWHAYVNSVMNLPFA
jgi:hypothetical protein